MMHWLCVAAGRGYRLAKCTPYIRGSETVTDLAIEAHGLTKAYRNVMVLAGVDLSVHRGRIQALLGPNGAGKTTLVHILTTLIKADTGTARVAGFDVAREGRQVRRPGW